MSTTYKLIDKVVVSSNIASITLGSGGTIPQTYTDLVVVASARTSDSGASTRFIQAVFNGSTSGYTYRRLFGTGSSAGSDTNTTTPGQLLGYINTSSQTANTFSTTEVYIPNYAGSFAKTLSSTSHNEDGGSAAFASAVAGLWNNTAPITSITISAEVGNLVTGSSFFLYGVNRVVSGVSATGGTVTDADGYRYHTFTSSGSFVVSEPGTVEYLVVAGGGGGGGWTYGGGGGGGGLLNGVYSITAGTHTVTVGSGGAGSDSTSGSSGNSSALAAISASGGGFGGGIGPTNGGSGGSGGGGGGGGGGASSQVNGGAGTAGQGYAGGGSYSESQRGAGGGGGGASAAGGNASQNLGGNGGAGRTVWGQAYAGGGGGATYNDFPSTPGTGGSGGGGAGGRNGTTPAGNGTANTGGGGGGRGTTIGNGGSGVVIIRYPL